MSRIPIRLPGKKSKYRAVRTNGYASKKEAGRGAHLKMLEKHGEISCLKEQVRFTLIPNQYAGKRLLERKIDYVADFEYRDKHGFIVVEDCKGMRTPAYILKRKLMLYCHGVKVQEI